MIAVSVTVAAQGVCCLYVLRVQELFHSKFQPLLLSFQSLLLLGSGSKLSRSKRVAKAG